VREGGSDGLIHGGDILRLIAAHNRTAMTVALAP